MSYEDRVLVRCPQTGDSEIVNVVDYTPKVSLTVDLFIGTPHNRRITLKWNTRESDYRAELWGRWIISRGPKQKSDRQKPVVPVRKLTKNPF